MRTSSIDFVFFGSSDFSVHVLSALEKAELLPVLIVTTPDKPIGRKQIVTPTDVKVWGQNHDIPVISPDKLDSAVIEEIKKYSPSVSVVASYGKILPKSILDIASHGTLNVHPSLLPLYRGATPIQSAMLDDMRNTGVSIILLDEKMDHGPVLGVKPVTFDEWPVYEEVEKKLAYEGGSLLSQILPNWIKGEIAPLEQNHDMATFTKKIDKSDAEISLPKDLNVELAGSEAREAFLKIQAYHHSPVAYFMFEKKSGEKIRVKILKASYLDDRLKIQEVVPEGKSSMDYSDFVRGYSELSQ
jgi:methionyl-tRNA formyltransferase